MNSCQWYKTLKMDAQLHKQNRPTSTAQTLLTPHEHFQLGTSRDGPWRYPDPHFSQDSRISIFMIFESVQNDFQFDIIRFCSENAVQENAVLDILDMLYKQNTC